MDIAHSELAANAGLDLGATKTQPGLPMILVVMGVSGSGKTTIGTQLALALTWAANAALTRNPLGAWLIGSAPRPLAKFAA